MLHHHAKTSNSKFQPYLTFHLRVLTEKASKMGLKRLSRMIHKTYCWYCICIIYIVPCFPLHWQIFYTQICTRKCIHTCKIWKKNARKPNLSEYIWLQNANIIVSLYKLLFKRYTRGQNIKEFALCSCSFQCKSAVFPAGNYMFKINSRNTRTSFEICSKLTIKIPQRRQWRRYGIFTVNFEHISHLVLVFLLLTMSR